MRSVILALFVLVATALAAFELDEGVIVLTDDNFDEVVGSNDVLLVEFYAPWCGHCKSLAPEYVKAAAALSGSSAKLAKLDATAHKVQAEKHGIRGFPTLKFFKHGHVTDYNGGRTSDEIVSWLNKKSGPVSELIDNESRLDALKEQNDVIVLGVFGSADSSAAKTFMDAAASDDSLVFVHTHHDAVKSKLGVTGDHIIVLKTFDDKRNDLAVSGSTTLEAITEFISGSSVPLVQTFSQDSAKKIFSSPIKNHLLFFTDVDSDHHAPTISTFTDIAKEFKGKVLVVNVPTSEKRVLDYFGMTADMAPHLVLAHMGENAMKKFQYPHKQLTSSHIKEFVNDYFAGKLSAHLKSEAPEADDTKQDVVVVRGTSFKDIVINNDKDILLEFYAPWCGHCKKLAPVLEEVGKHFKGENVVIAKMDATANEVDFPGLEVKGYPSLFWFKGNDKTKAIKYESGREASNFIDYIHNNAHNAIKHSHDHDDL